jgi:hypothetical protein
MSLLETFRPNRVSHLGSTQACVMIDTVLGYAIIWTASQSRKISLCRSTSNCDPCLTQDQRGGHQLVVPFGTFLAHLDQFSCNESVITARQTSDVYYEGPGSTGTVLGGHDCGNTRKQKQRTNAFARSITSTFFSSDQRWNALAGPFSRPNLFFAHFAFMFCVYFSGINWCVDDHFNDHRCVKSEWIVAEAHPAWKSADLHMYVALLTAACGWIDGNSM